MRTHSGEMSSVTDGFKMRVGLHQQSVLSPFLLSLVMDRLTLEVRLESLRCSQMYKRAWNGRDKVNRSKTNICV